MKLNSTIVAAGVIGVVILMYILSKKNATAAIVAEDNEEVDEEEEPDCTGPCEVAHEEVGCVQCILGPEGSACYPECNMPGLPPEGCDQCLGELDYEPEWLEKDVWGEYEEEQEEPEMDPGYGYVQGYGY